MSRMIQVDIDGQGLDLPEEYCKTDKALRDALAPYYPGAENSDIERVEKDGALVSIKVKKRAGRKGSRDVIAVFDAAPEEVGAAIHYAALPPRRLTREQLEAAVKEAAEAARAGARAARALDRAPGVPCHSVPEGF